MTKLLEQALREIERLPVSEQDAVADAISDHLRHRGRTVLTDAQVAEVHRRITDPDRKFLSLEDVRARIARLHA